MANEQSEGDSATSEKEFNPDTRYFQRFLTASEELGQQIRERTEQQTIDPAYSRDAAVYARPDLNLPAESSLSTVIEAVHGYVTESKLPRRVGIYLPGIAGLKADEKPFNTSEFSSSSETFSDKAIAAAREIPRRKLTRMAMSLSPQKGEFDQGAVDFLYTAGYGAGIMLEPPSEDFTSSLSADAVSLQETVKVCKDHGVMPDIVAWSNSGFKLAAILRGAHDALRNDLRWALERGMDIENRNPEELLLKVRLDRESASTIHFPDEKNRGKKQSLWRPVFVTGYDAYRFLETLKDTRIVLAGAPLNASELAVPVSADVKNPLFGMWKTDTRSLLNELVSYVGKNEHRNAIQAVISSRLLPDGLKVITSRLLEMGRGKDLEDILREIEREGRVSDRASVIMRTSLDRAIVGIVMDRSGQVVDSSHGGVFKVLTAILGEEKVLGMQLRSVPSSSGKQDSSEKELFSLDEKHELIKVGGALDLSLAWMSGARAGMLMPKDVKGVLTGAVIMPVSTRQTGTVHGLRTYGSKGVNWRKFLFMDQTQPWTADEYEFVYAVSDKRFIGAEEDPDSLKEPLPRNPLKAMREMVYRKLDNTLFGSVVRGAAKTLLASTSFEYGLTYNHIPNDAYIAPLKKS